MLHTANDYLAGFTLKSPEEINKGIKKWMEFLGKMKTSFACASFFVNVDEGKKVNVKSVGRKKL